MPILSRRIVVFWTWNGRSGQFGRWWILGAMCISRMIDAGLPKRAGTGRFPRLRLGSLARSRGDTRRNSREKGRVLGGSTRAVGQEHGGSWLPDPQVSSSQSWSLMCSCWCRGTRSTRKGDFAAEADDQGRGNSRSWCRCRVLAGTRHSLSAVSDYRRSMLITRNVQGTGDFYSAQCQYHRRRHLPTDEIQKLCMETRSCDDRDVSELCRFAGESARHTNVLPDCAVPKHFPCFFGQAMDQSNEMDQFTCSPPVGWMQYRFRQRTCDAQQTERHKQTFQKRASSFFTLGASWTLGAECCGKESHDVIQWSRWKLNYCLMLEHCWTSDQSTRTCVRVSENTRTSGTSGSILRRTVRDSICNSRISVNEIPRTDARSSSCQYGHEWNLPGSRSGHERLSQGKSKGLQSQKQWIAGWGWYSGVSWSGQTQWENTWVTAGRIVPPVHDESMPMEHESKNDS